MEKDNRPKARQKNVQGQGSGVHRRGEGTGQGPVGDGGNIFQRKDSNPRPTAQGTRPSGTSGQTGQSRPGGGSRQVRGRGGMNPLLLIIVAAVILLGGGGGLSGLLGGGGSSTSTGSGYNSSQNSTSQSSSSQSSTSQSSSSQSSSVQNGSAQGSSSQSSQAQSSSAQSSQAQSSSQNSTAQSVQTGTTASNSGSGAAGNNPNYASTHSGSNNGVLNRSVSPLAREKYTAIRGNGQDTVTIMVYMCGTDLESRSRMGTADLTEMAKASLSDRINLLVYTGGCSRWQNNIVSSSVNQIYQIRDGGLACLNSNAGTGSMTNPNTLSGYISWAAKNFPADRYELILWDHGGGSLSGYGYDEKNRSSGSMSLASLSSALKTAGIKFDFIGFDACLMATVENARMLADYADYMIASEETEPGIGWYYTNWLTELSRNTSLPTLDIGKRITDDFVSTCASQCRGQSATLSVVDLAELSQTLSPEMSAFSQDMLEKIRSNNYRTVATARNNAREFAQSSVIDQIDFVDFAWKMDTSQGRALADVLLDAVKYNQTSSNINRAYGLSVYFPYKKMSSVNTAVQTYNALEMDEDFADCIREFASLELGGQMSSGVSGSPLESLFGGLFGSSYGTSGSTGGAYTSSGSGSHTSSGSGSYGSYSGGMDSGDIADLLSALLGGGSGSTYGSSSGSYGNSYGNSYGSSSYGNSYGSSGSGTMDILGSLLGGSSSGSGSMAGTLFSGLGSLAGLDTSFFGGRSFDVEAAAQYLAENQFDASSLYWQKNKDGNLVISLPEDQWDLIQEVQKGLFYDDGTGYIELGRDDTYFYDDERNLLPDTEKTWLHIGGQPVAYFSLGSTEKENGSYIYTGRVPANLNGQRVNLILSFDEDEAEWNILGAQTDYAADETDTVARGLTELKAGDKLDFLADFYSYEGDVQDSYLIGNTLEVTDDMTVMDAFLDDQNTLILYRFTDMYQQHYWTEVLPQ